MELVVGIVLGSVLSWFILLITMPVAQRVADYALPPWGEMLGKLAVVAVLVNTASGVVGLHSELLGLLIGAVLFWILMVKWFDVDMMGAVCIVLVSWFVGAFLQLGLQRIWLALTY